MVHLTITEETENGLRVTVENNFPEWLLDSILLPNKMRFTLVKGMYGEEWITMFPKARICHVIDHEPVLTPNYVTALDNRKLTLTDVIQAQRLKSPDGSWYIDDYGFYLYAVPVLSLTGEDIGVNHAEPQ